MLSALISLAYVLLFGRLGDVAAKRYKFSEDPTLVTLFVIGSVLMVRCGSGNGTASVPQLTAVNLPPPQFFIYTTIVVAFTPYPLPTTQSYRS
jgi:hypothetical protein